MIVKMPCHRITVVLGTLLVYVAVISEYCLRVLASSLLSPLPSLRLSKGIVSIGILSSRPLLARRSVFVN
jgi:hypothetical protein